MPVLPLDIDHVDGSPTAGEPVDTRAEAGYARFRTTEGTSGEKTVTEHAWLNCTEPGKMLSMLKYLRMSGRASDRKFRLFACSCCRPIGHFLKDERSREAVEIAEHFAEGAVTRKELFDAHNDAMDARNDLANTYRTVSDAETDASHAASWAACWEGGAIEVARHASDSAAHAHSHEGQETAEKRSQCQLLLCIFGSVVYRPVALSAAVLPRHDGLLVSMARQMYDSRNFRDMPILADALEEAVCTNQDILTHCPQPGPHVRGCWVVDAILGRS